MSGRLWEALLRQYGQPVTLRNGEETAALHAFLQPVPDRSESQRPGPRGVEEQGRFLYLGPARCPLDRDTVVLWRGMRLRVRTALRRGDPLCPHWWAVLAPAQEAAG